MYRKGNKTISEVYQEVCCQAGGVTVHVISRCFVSDSARSSHLFVLESHFLHLVHWWQVASLFHNHADLLEEFTYFLPETNGPPSYGAAAPPSVKSVGNHSSRRDDKGAGQIPRHGVIEKTVKVVIYLF